MIAVREALALFEQLVAAFRQPETPPPARAGWRQVRICLVAGCYRQLNAEQGRNAA